MAEGSPINDIMQMKQQGLSNNQIVNSLQRAGYTNTQIFDAMNQADTKMAVEGVNPSVLDSAQTEQTPVQSSGMFTQPPPEVETPTNAPIQEPTNLGMPQSSPTMGASTPSYADDSVQVEELVEAIIEEKWSDLVKDVNKIVEWKNKMESKISEIEVTVNSLKESFSDLNRAILGKVNDYDKHILEIGSDIKAMEQVFSKVLPGFTENVNELSRIADKMKKGDQN